MVSKLCYRKHIRHFVSEEKMTGTKIMKYFTCGDLMLKTCDIIYLIPCFR